jgi:hypothetical protein
MLFHRPSLAWTTLAMHAAPKIQVRVHAPMEIVLRPIAPAPAMVHTQVSPAFAPQRQLQAGPANLLVHVNSRSVRTVVLQEKFMHARSMATDRIKTVERMWQPVRQLCTAWLRKPSVSVTAQALPLGLRQCAHRTERPAKDLPHMTAPVRQYADRGMDSVPARSGQATTPWTTVLHHQPAAPAPAINVEALTSQVMQQIDRRLVAWRERMGRV